MSIKPKVAFLIYSLNAGGAERVVSNLANELVNSFDITIIVLYECEPFYKLDERISVTFCSEFYNPGSNIFLSLQNHFKLFSSLLKILKEKKIDLSIGFMTTSNIYLSIASKLTGIPCIISERIHPDYRHLKSLWKKARQISYKYASVLVVQTASIKEYFETFLKPENIIIIKNPLSTELIEKRKNYNSRENVILNVGSLSTQKHQDLLINAFSNVNNKDWKLVLVGDGELKSKYQNLIHSLNLEQKVTLVGNVSNVEDYYNSASMFVFPSRYEGFPNALIEAMHFGLPSISTDCPSGPSEIISSGVNGFLIPVEDQEELENKLKTLMADENLRQKFSRRAIESTIEFQPQIISSIWKNLIVQVLS